MAEASLDVELHLLGGFDLRRKRGAATPPVPLAAQRLLAFLALGERALHRTHVAASLWPDTTEHKARASLRSAVWRLGTIGGEVLDVTSTHMRLASCVWVDARYGVEQARRLADRTADLPHIGLDGFVLKADLLTDWYDDWVLIERERLRQLRLHALEALCTRLADAERYSEAVEAGLGAVAAEPLRESAQRTLIRVHLKEGNRSEALRQYERYRAVLREELGTEPGFSIEEVTTGLCRATLR